MSPLLFIAILFISIILILLLGGYVLFVWPKQLVQAIYPE